MRHATMMGMAGALLAFGLAGPSLAQDAAQAGVSAAVRGEVQLARAAGAVGRQVESGEAIFLRDAITSGAASGMQILLLDETVFTIGPQSEIVIDEFVYDPASEAGRLTAEMTRGVLRFVTGKVASGDPQAMTINLPVGSIGIRGTMGVIRVLSPTEAVQQFPQLGNQVPVGPVVFAALSGPGFGNNADGSSGAFDLIAPSGTSQSLTREGFGALLFDGQVSEPFRAPPELTSFDLGLTTAPPAGQGNTGAGQPGATAQGAANPAGTGGGLTGGAVQQAQTQTGQQLASVLDQVGTQQASQTLSDNSAATSQIASTAAGNSFTFDALRQVTSGSFERSITGISGGGLSYDFYMQLNFSNRQATIHFSNISDGAITGGELGGNAQSFASLSGVASFPQSPFMSPNGACSTGGCSGAVTMTSTLDVSYSLSTSAKPTAVGGSTTLQ